RASNHHHYTSVSHTSFSFFYCSADHRDLHSFPTRRSSDLGGGPTPCPLPNREGAPSGRNGGDYASSVSSSSVSASAGAEACAGADRKSTRLNSSHQIISYAVFCLKKKKKNTYTKNNVVNMT